MRAPRWANVIGRTEARIIAPRADLGSARTGSRPETEFATLTTTIVGGGKREGARCRRSARSRSSWSSSWPWWYSVRPSCPSSAGRSAAAIASSASSSRASGTTSSAFRDDDDAPRYEDAADDTPRQIEARKPDPSASPEAAAGWHHLVTGSVAATENGGRMTVVEHLSELRRRIVISIIAVTLSAIVCFIVSESIIKFLITYYRDATAGEKDALIFLGPLGAFLTRIKIATYGGIVLALPVWLFELWRFITPGSTRREALAIPFVLSSIVLFAMGAFVAFLTLPKALEFLLDVGGSQLRPELTADKYLSFVSLMTVAFGVAFEFPVVLVFLLLARVVTARQLRRWRRPAAVIIVVFAAVITPSQDPYSLFFMAVPMYMFYEISIIIGRVLKR